MKILLKALALLAAITSVVWIAVIWRWQVTHRDMSVDDLVLDLVVLPLVLFALLLGFRWAVRAALGRQAAALATATAETSAAMERSGKASTAESKEGLQAWPLLGAWVVGSTGDDMGGMLEAAKAGKPGPRPDKSLRDARGLPVMCARAEAIDTAVFETQRDLPCEATHPRPDPHVVRALAGLSLVLAPAGERIRQWQAAIASKPQHDTPVRVLVAWPEAWTEPDRTLAGGWLNARLLDLGGDVSDPECWAIQCLPPCSGPQAWQHAEGLLSALERQRRDALVLLLACHSDISEPAIDALQRGGRLFDAEGHPKGQMPGEGAAALLLTPSVPPELAGSQEAVAWLHRAASVRREKSIDAPARPDAGAARQVTADALAFAALDGAGLRVACSDADRHSPRATELFGTTIELLPHLDPVEDLRLLGVVQGHASHTGALWAIAGAALQASEGGQPALALSLADPHWRMALVARHAPVTSNTVSRP
jgi:hypothetical protein